MPHLFGGWRRRRGTLHEGTHEPCGQKGTHVETAPAGSPNRCFKHTCAGWLEMVQGCQFGGCLESESQRQPTKIIHERNALDFATVNLSCVMDLGQRRVFPGICGSRLFFSAVFKETHGPRQHIQSPPKSSPSNTQTLHGTAIYADQLTPQKTPM